MRKPNSTYSIRTVEGLLPCMFRCMTASLQDSGAGDLIGFSFSALFLSLTFDFIPVSLLLS